MDIYGNIGSTMNSQGLVYAINIYFGVVYNAAATLANTVNGILMSLTTNIAVAFRPQIIKQYSIGNLAAMKDVMCNSVKFTLIATAMLSVPCIFEADYVLKLWLGKIPEYGPEFLRIILILSFFTFINSVCNVAIHATGNIKYLTFINGSVFMILPVAIFYLFHLGLNAITAYFVEIAGTVLIIFNAIAIIHKQIPEYDIRSFIKVILCCISLIAVTSLSFRGSFVLLPTLLPVSRNRCFFAPPTPARTVARAARRQAHKALGSGARRFFRVKFLICKTFRIFAPESKRLWGPRFGLGLSGAQGNT